MINKLIIIILSISLYVPMIALSALNEVDAQSPEQVVASFQKFPYYAMFCKDKKLGREEPIKVGSKFKPYFSNNFYKLFLWIECGQPEIPPRHDGYGQIEGWEPQSIRSWDIRFAIAGEREVPNAESVLAENIRVLPTKLQGPDKAIVNVLFDYDREDTVTIYTLIREAGQWKIDDIAPTCAGAEEIIDCSDSIKTDMQNNYNAALARYKKEQAKQNAVPKP